MTYTGKLKTLAVAAAGLLLLGACSDGPAPGANQTAAPQGSTGASTSSVQLIEAGKLTVCTHLPYAPFQSGDDSGKTVGFDVDMMDLVAKKLGVEQKIVDTPFEGIKSGQDLSSGKCDIAAAGMTITEERQKVMLFSAPYFDATQALLTPTGSGIKSLADLKGKKVGAQASTTGLDYARSKEKEFGYTIVEYQDLASETQALLQGQIAAAINDLPVWTEALKQNPGKAEISAQFDTGEQYGFAMKLGNSALKTVVDETISTAKSDGTYDKIYTKWIGEVPR